MNKRQKKKRYPKPKSCNECGSMTVCDYCGQAVRKPLRVGKILSYCNTECFTADCLGRYPETSLAGMVAKMWG